VGHEFDRGIEVTRVGEGEYDATLDPGWVVGGGINGGYLLAVVANALRASLHGKPDPITMTVHFLTASTPGPARVSTRTLRDGGSVATASAELLQDGVRRIAVLTTNGDLANLPVVVETTAVEPDLPAPEECTVMPDEVRATLPLTQRFEMRFDPATAGFLRGEPSGRGLIQSWFRLADGRQPDALSLLLALDAMPPVTFDLGNHGWAPTLELTAHVRAVPAPGWLKLSHRTRNIAGGMFEEDCEVWDSTGRLVAQSRQLARLPR